MASSTLSVCRCPSGIKPGPALLLASAHNYGSQPTDSRRLPSTHFPLLGIVVSPGCGTVPGGIPLLYKPSTAEKDVPGDPTSSKAVRTGIVYVIRTSEDFSNSITINLSLTPFNATPHLNNQGKSPPSPLSSLTFLRPFAVAIQLSIIQSQSPSNSIKPSQHQTRARGRWPSSHTIGICDTAPLHNISPPFVAAQLPGKTSQLELLIPSSTISPLSITTKSR